ncbi:hypothetical protein Slin15195_G129190 [Septoria linicola]|uniref:Uncharacterized protein n=1 Tax=Septoria linicola TaxID=215465 RepID=A0A9Q9B2T4_9PEZI|nr:hypothetical protein Slin14017_G121730 [Septoria linicola]USW59600.1 hypothetical protein Slin15195_G129190 [Septoria linicola]
MVRHTVSRERKDGRGTVDEWDKEMLTLPSATGAANEVACGEKWRHVVSVPELGGTKTASRETVTAIRVRLDGVVLHIEVDHHFLQTNNTAAPDDDSHVDHRWTTCADINLRRHFAGVGALDLTQPAHDLDISAQLPMPPPHAPPPPPPPPPQHPQHQQQWLPPGAVQHRQPQRPSAVPTMPKAMMQQQQHHHHHHQHDHQKPIHRSHHYAPPSPPPAWPAPHADDRYRVVRSREVSESPLFVTPAPDPARTAAGAAQYRLSSPTTPGPSSRPQQQRTKTQPRRRAPREEPITVD